MRTITIFLTFLAVQTLNAQLSPLATNLTTYVFGDKVNVRSEASPDGKVVAQLNGGEAVTVIEQSDKTYEQSGNKQPWYKVRFGKNQTGYIWGGLLSYIGEAYSSDAKFTVGITAVKTKKDEEGMAEYTLETRVFSNSGALLGKTAQTITAESGYYISADPVYAGALGLKGYTALLVSRVGYDACGYPSHDWYVLWDGKKLVPLPVCTSVFDADVFHHSEDYLFPQAPNENEQGHFSGEDKIFFQVSHSEKQYEGDDDTQGWNEESYVRARPLKWDGVRFVRPQVEK